MGKVREYTAVAAVLLLMLTGCGGGSDDNDDLPPSQAVVDLPPAGTSRISSVEFDSDADGHVDLVERYSYNEIGLLTRIESMTVVNDIESSPVETIVRTYDSHRQVLEIRTRTAAGEISLKATYGADGRLATTTTTKTPTTPGPTWADGPRSTLMQFAWNDDRMTKVILEDTFGDGNGFTNENVASFSYGVDGKIASIDWETTGIDEYGPAYYSWRTDGQLSRLTYWNHALEGYVSENLDYDEEGRLVEIQETTSNPFDDPRSHRVKYDNRGRPVLMEIDYFFSEVFVVRSTRRVRWEDQPCQPVYEPQMIPTVNSITGAASPIGATLVCSSRP